MDGSGIIRGLLIPLKHFFVTYIDDLKWLGKKYFKPEGISLRSSAETRGIFTVQYPEEKLPVPEEFRFIPFLVYDEGQDGSRQIRCTACGICTKVCPPQCIWIERHNDAETGRPVSTPVSYTIDIDLCMNCGFCAEFCPFDAIRMDHDYELANTNRYEHDVLQLEELLKPASYYASIRPENYTREEVRKAEKLASKTIKTTEMDTANPN
ncbi:4Fe-4S binding protein [Leptolinea tardivitalis]|uniref:4Fe-4S binding protein n=1 Tax=Leptolinea tardivitalis TaxID=229920 RepID=UPI000783350C|nr:4Fe-4S binding protein [Leptolinea tardivitalis]GAP23005.1 formate hydrogenlyase subunit 6 [Leptolinea tardivitalis]